MELRLKIDEHELRQAVWFGIFGSPAAVCRVLRAISKIPRQEAGSILPRQRRSLHLIPLRHFNQWPRIHHSHENSWGRKLGRPENGRPDG